MNKKVCLLYTGGTIAMHRDNYGVLRPPENVKDFLNVNELKKSEYDFYEILNKDSTNIIPDDWTKIAETIYNLRDENYEGFVVAHGTDTMHFSASAVALALGKNINFPVVFTGAQTAPDVRHGDARVNLLRSFKVATSEIAEVVICFGDYVFRGCRAQKKDERRFDAFESPAYFPLAHVTENILVTNMAWKRDQKNGQIELKSKFSSGILQVSLIPGLEHELLETLLENKTCKGIVLQSFGAGNVPNNDAGERYSWENFIKRAKELGKPVLITSQFPANATSHTAYEPGKAAETAGAIPTGNMTSACATAKFRWILAQVDDIEDKDEKLKKIREMMNESYVGEFDQE